MTSHFISEISSIIFLAFAISMDAFSVSLGYGLQKPRLRRIIQIGLLIGFFHMVFPFIGIVLGQLISVKVGHFTSVLSGLLLIGIGFHMLFSIFDSQRDKQIHMAKIALLSLAFIVSLDSFSIGLSLGLSEVRIAMTLILFGTISMVMTWIGMLLGRKINLYVGTYSEILGGGILISFGLHILFG